MIEQIYYSQSGQDKFIFNHFFKNYEKPGFFIELGALDGILISNTLFYEKILKWNGICIEPTSHYYQKLLLQRNCYKFNDVIFDQKKDIIFYEAPSCCDSLNGIKELYDPRHIKRIERESIEYKQENNNIETIKRTRTMDSILKEVNVKDIDFLSLDTEGSELNILKSINWLNTKIKIICVENNYGDLKIHNFLLSLNYIFFKQLDGDFIYYHPKLIQPIKN